MTVLNQVEQLTTKPEPRKRVSIIKAAIIKERTMLYGARQINTPAIAADLARTLFTNTDREMLIVTSLDAKCNPMSLEIAAIGNVNTCIVSPREIFKNAILSNAVYIMIFHNHLSGDCTPSSEDIAITKRLIECGDLIGIQLLDHVITGYDKDFLSLREESIVAFRATSPAYLKDY